MLLDAVAGGSGSVVALWAAGWPQGSAAGACLALAGGLAGVALWVPVAWWIDRRPARRRAALEARKRARVADRVADRRRQHARERSRAAVTSAQTQARAAAAARSRAPATPDQPAPVSALVVTTGASSRERADGSPSSAEALG
jgi:hypothetical protein